MIGAISRPPGAARHAVVVVVLACLLLVADGCATFRHGAILGPTRPRATAGDCSPALRLSASTTSHTLRVGRSARSYLLHIPPGYTGVRPLPVVVTFHGYGQTAEEQLALSDFSALADRDGFVVVAPESLGPGWDFSPPSSDYTFITALMTALPTVACVDRHRLYATGISEGAAVVFSLACADVGGFAAYGAVAGAFYWPQCAGARPQPIVYFHGTSDPLVPINGGRIAGGTVAPARQSMAAWAMHNGCRSGPRQSAVTSDVTLLAWTGCREAADVEYYVIAGGGHSWPGAPPAIARAAGALLGRTTESISASQIMWDFFAARRR